ncbi:allophanate hydrolase subunit 1 [Mumia zhuanghuii]|uniref:Allophanate hydrolase subunit 1 n=2 Tax=Mumia TaxID=1546255 RepID=A0ABW1QQZ3_9ACTN|nr:MULTISPECIES: allophanate hydrolase subunit 1 [Mumia]KAA1423780.1 allophanate hydrolase subunit 1 [Mumia zhuanghuii]
MRLTLYGDRALIADLDDAGAVVAWADAVRAAGLAGVADVVPAARTVLVVADDGADLAQLAAALVRMDFDAGAVLGGDAAGEGDAIVVHVRYDGPDLQEVAELTGLGVRGVVDAHTGHPWRVAFGGFAPGFAYLVGGDPRLQVPRRPRARTAVPAGAVGLAGEYSGIYPRSSPGGWQLIGTTDATLWDLDREPPALLRPGAAVQFVEEHSVEEHSVEEHSVEEHSVEERA